MKTVVRNIEKHTEIVKTIDLFKKRVEGQGSLKESTVFTVFIRLLTVHNGFQRVFTVFIRSVIFLGACFVFGSFGRPWGWFLCSTLFAAPPLGGAGRMAHCTRGVLGAFHWVDGEEAYGSRVCGVCVWRGERRRGGTQ